MGSIAPHFAVAYLVLAVANTIAAVRYVDVNNSSPSAPYTSWATAARTIQEAIDRASAGDSIFVTNGVYETGGRSAHGTTPSFPLPGLFPGCGTCIGCR